MKSILSAVAVFILLCFAASSQAAITYVNFGEGGYFPDTTYYEYSDGSGYSTWSYSASYTLELPTNSTALYRLGYSHYRSDYANGSHFENTNVSFYNLNIMGEQDSGQLVAYKLAEDVLVDGEGPYISHSLLYDWRSENYYGRWEDMAEGETAYLGFTFINTDGVDCYGWMELHIDEWDGYVTIYGYAWDDSGNTILTGQTGSVPVPGAVWLLGSGLLGLAGIRRRK